MAKIERPSEEVMARVNWIDCSNDRSRIDFNWCGLNGEVDVLNIEFRDGGRVIFLNPTPILHEELPNIIHAGQWLLQENKND